MRIMLLPSVLTFLVQVVLLVATGVAQECPSVPNAAPSGPPTPGVNRSEIFFLIHDPVTVEPGAVNPLGPNLKVKVIADSAGVLKLMREGNRESK